MERAHNEAEESTHAIIQEKWYDKIQCTHHSQKTRLNIDIWDFGGQHLYHGTHRIFMQSNSYRLC